MKRSSWISRVLVLAVKHETEILDAAAIAAQEWAGKPWDPEEPELPEWPERLEVPDGTCFFWWPGKKLFIQLGKLRTVYQEAARRYNAYPELESLARELYSDLKLHHEMREAGECASGRCPTCELLSRAKETLR